jgi:hypothetical protein
MRSNVGQLVSILHNSTVGEHEIVTRRTLRRGWTTWVVSALLTLCATLASAQPSMSLSGSVFPAGPDFATDTFGDPWDFSNVLDLDPHPDGHVGWTTSTQSRVQGRGLFLNNGRFQATTDTTNLARVSLLFRGWAEVLNTGRTGAFAHMAVPTARYGKLAIKMRYTNPAPAPNRAMAAWHHRQMREPDELTNAGLLLFGEPTHGWGLYIVDLQTRQWVAADGSLQISPLQAPWTGGTPAAWEGSPLARGVEFRAQALPGFNVPVEVDWVRLTARDGQAGASTLSVNYSNCSGIYVLRISDVENVPFTVARGVSSGSGSFPFNYGVLAPGAYTASLTCGNGTSSAEAFTVNAPPVVTVIDPDVTGGSDFASDVLGNPWDMADAADVPVIEGVTSPGLVTDAGLPALQATGTSTGDPRVTLLNGAAGLVNTGRYRKLTYTLTLDTPFGLDGSLGHGSVARILWGSQMLADANSMTNSNDILVWPGRETYTVDLGALSTANGGIETDCGVCTTRPWSSHAARFLRFDPHESTQGVTFRLAQVKLAALDEVAQGQTFPVRYRFDDPDTGSTFTAHFYLDADHDPSSGLRLIGTMPDVRPGTELTYPLTAPLDLAAPQDYFVYVRVTETRSGGITDVRGSYSGGPLHVLGASSEPVLTVSNPAANSSHGTPLTVTGCAYDAAGTTGINVDQVNAFAIAGVGMTGPQAGTTQVLGFGGGFGTLAFPVDCPTASGNFANAGFTVSGIDALAAGSWTLRVISRSTTSGLFTTHDVPFTVVSAVGVPQGFTASASGNLVTVSFGAATGVPVGSYLVEGATDPTFSAMLFSIRVLNPGSYDGTLANGTYYLRIVSVSPTGARVAATGARMLVVGPPPPPPPGPPTLTGSTSANPVTLNWTQGPGGAPTSYTLAAGTTPGGSDLVVAPMGLATGISANAPMGTTVYVRVIASNAGGSAASNELQVRILVPGTPDTPSLAPASLNGNVVTLSWAPRQTGDIATSYVVLARYPGASTIIASLPATSTSLSVPAPSGTYIVSVVALNAAGASPESNTITVAVP